MLELELLVKNLHALELLADFVFGAGEVDEGLSHCVGVSGCAA